MAKGAAKSSIRRKDLGDIRNLPHLRPLAAKSSIRKGKREDRLSKLPDDILVGILDRLHVRDAARTTMVSRRWSRLSAELSRLILNARDFLPSGGPDANNMSGDDFVRVNAAAVKATESILTRRNPGEHTISLLSTTFYLSEDAPINIGHAVGNAMVTNKIGEAEFTVLTVKERKQCTFDDRVNYGTQFVSFFSDCSSAFSGLTRLSLENLSFAESIFSNILVTCQQLKYLGFLNCGTNSLITHQLELEHAQLGELSMVSCRFPKVDLKWLPGLTQIDFADWRPFEELPLSFGHVPMLEVVSLQNAAREWHEMVKLSTLLAETSVQDLMLGFRCEKIWVQPECLTKSLASAFHRLKIINLCHIPEGYDLTWTMFILEAAPSLEEFYMMVIDHPCQMQMDKEKRRERLFAEQKGVEWESPKSKFKHHRLTRLIIFCFESYMASHVRRVMEAAVNLKYVFLYRRLSCDKCKHIKPTKPITWPRTKKHRCSARKLMTQGIQTRARIHFLDFGAMSADHVARLP